MADSILAEIEICYKQHFFGVSWRTHADRLVELTC